MKRRWTIGLVISLIAVCSSPVLGADASLFVEALIDGRDQLIIKGNTLRWEHFTYAAVGRHNGLDEPTTITTTLDGQTLMGGVAWTPQWSAPPPEQFYSQHEFSSVYTGLQPQLSQQAQIVSLTPLQVRSGASIDQQPTAANDYTLIVGFNDIHWSSSATYRVRLDYQAGPPPPPPIQSQQQTGRRTSGAFGWDYDYDIGFDDQTIRIDLAIQLVGADPGDALRDQWEHGIEDIWSNHYNVQDGGSTYPIVVEVDWVDSAAEADYVVTVHNSLGRHTLTDWYTQTSWGAQYQDEIAAHEAGHMFALYDEYAGGAINPTTGLIATNALMGDLGAVQERYYEDILLWLEGELNRDLSLIGAASPPAPQDPPITGYYDDPVPEPATLTLLALGGLAVLRKRRRRS
ncbi:MAG: PEP-CTERM sorting domain-containing protein [Phycisphaerae bacterium]|jgi:hypothetical protein|nr:PEP-CTERM sorting domain-containing protein [Phycisphaerae bacterium]